MAVNTTMFGESHLWMIIPPEEILPNIVEVPSSAVSCLVTASVAARAGHCLRDNSATAAGPSTLIALQATLAKGVVFIT